MKLSCFGLICTYFVDVMGADIHIVFEYYDEAEKRWFACNTWDIGFEYQDVTLTPERAEEYGFPMFCGYRHRISRNYIAFGYLGYDRGDYKITPMSVQKLPKDLSAITEDLLIRMGHDAHTKRMLTLETFRAYKPSDTTELGRPHQKPLGTEKECFENEFAFKTLRGILKSIERRHGPARMIYWFDN